MKKTFQLIITLAILLVVHVNKTYAQTKLSLSSWAPPTHPIVRDMIIPWTEKVKEVTEGRVIINVLAKGLGHPKVHYDVARNGLADITYGVHGYTPGRFTMTKVVEFPFGGDSAEALSVAYWRVHQKFLSKANEHRGTQLLGVFSHGPGFIHNSKKAIDSMDDLSGMKLRVGGGVVNDVAKSLKAVPLLKPASKSYELLSHGVADGTLLPMESVASFKIQDLVKYTTVIPGGLYNISFFLVMNRARFADLSKKDQDAIMSVSGEAFSKMAGRVWDNIDKKALDTLKANGNTITTASPALLDSIKQSSTLLENKWIRSAQKKGVDGKAALAELRQISANYHNNN